MKLIPNAVSRKVARQLLLAQKNSPTLLFGAGVVGMVGSTVLACRATLKLEEVVIETQNDLNQAKKTNERHPEEYPESDRKRDTTIIYTRGVLRVVKLYGPSLLLGGASIACLTKSHHILSERNAALAAAYTAVDTAFEKYRKRVIEKYGEDEDRELRYGAESVEVIDEETGRVETRLRVGDETPSMYARFFDEYSTQWSKDPEYNLVFLRAQQSYANELLRARGHLFLNEVYGGLGMEHTTAGSVVGWVISEDGDNYVDFGLYDNKDEVRDFVNGREGAILLDFNVDGVIYDKIDKNRGERLAWQR
jgi:Family of unknown function (DUF6353)